MYTHFKKTLLLFWGLFLKQNRKLKWLAIASILLILVDIAAATLVPYYIKATIDHLSINLFKSAFIALIFLSVFWVIEKTITHVQEIVFFPVINQSIRDLYYTVIEKVHQIPFKDYQELSIPETLNSMRRISLSARSFIKTCCLLIIPTVIKLCVATILIIKISWFGFLLLPSLFLMVAGFYKGGALYMKAREAAWHISDQVMLKAHDSLLNTKTVRQNKAFEMEQMGYLLNEEARAWLKTNVRLHSIHIFVGMITGLTLFSILGGIVMAIHQGQLTVGDFVLIKAQLWVCFLPLRTLSVEFRQVLESLIDIKKIIALLSLPTQTNQSFVLSRSDADIQLNAISFSYTKHPDTYLLKAISLDVFQNQKIALIGANGCGKSTLLHLIAGFYTPLSGTVSIKQQKSVYLIPQDFRLFNGTLRENLNYGLKPLEDKILFTTLKKVALVDLINDMPLGLDTPVGEMGIKLSGGENQQIALARALLLKPDILLLDEATRSLNKHTKRIILNALYDAIPTILLTTHEADVLKTVDRIFEIKEGVLEAQTHSPFIVPLGEPA